MYDHCNPLKATFMQAVKQGQPLRELTPDRLDPEIRFCVFLFLLSIISFLLPFQHHLSSSSQEGWAIGLDLPNGSGFGPLSPALK